MGKHSRTGNAKVWRRSDDEITAENHESIKLEPEKVNIKAMFYNKVVGNINKHSCNLALFTAE